MNPPPKKNCYIFAKESFSCISGNGSPEKIIYILGGTSKIQKNKVSFISSKKFMNKFF